MNTEPMVSVLMTAYNREKFISESIKSVLDSTFADFEFIIVDDGSTDKTVEIIRDFEKADNRIKVFINKKNLGDYPNRNQAASYAIGKYLKYVDSDDLIYPNGLQEMVSAMEENPAAGFGICSLADNNSRPFPFMLQPAEAYEYHFFGPGLFHKGPLSAIFLRSAFEKAGGFKPARMVSDTDMWHRMGLSFPVVLMPAGIVWERRHQEQELSSMNQYILEYEKIKWEYLNDPKCALTLEQKKLIKKKRIRRYVRFIMSGLIKVKSHQVKNYFMCLLFSKTVKVR